jgi:exoribonuclease R
MDKAEARGGQIERAVIDLAETALLTGRIGEQFDAVVTDLGETGARIQFCDLPVVARVDAHSVVPGKRLRVRLDGIDAERRALVLTRVS